MLLCCSIYSCAFGLFDNGKRLQCESGPAGHIAPFGTSSLSFVWDYAKYKLEIYEYSRDQCVSLVSLHSRSFRRVSSMRIRRSPSLCSRWFLWWSSWRWVSGGGPFSARLSESARQWAHRTTGCALIPVPNPHWTNIFLIHLNNTSYYMFIIWNSQTSNRVRAREFKSAVNLMLMVIVHTGIYLVETATWETYYINSALYVCFRTIATNLLVQYKMLSNSQKIT